jgi:hypothetical protein
VSTQQADRFIYVVGEQQRAIIPESAEVFSFTQRNMQQIDTRELASVVANVFAKGQFFPGSDEVLTSVIHELIGRSESYRTATSQRVNGRCTLITAFKRLDGEISVKVAAIIPVEPGALNIEKPESFHALLLEKLPEFQQVFIEEAYAPDSTIIAIIKETAMHHINKELQ